MGKSLGEIVEKHEGANVFLDEVPFGSKAISALLLNDLSKEIPKDLYLWVACQAHETHYLNDLSGMLVIWFILQRETERQREREGEKGRESQEMAY